MVSTLNRTPLNWSSSLTLIAMLSPRCLCVTRWKEAFKARDALGDKVVPKVMLEATHQDTLAGRACRKAMLPDSDDCVHRTLESLSKSSRCLL